MSEIYVCYNMFQTGSKPHFLLSDSLTVQDGLSPLYVASHGGHSDVVDILLEAGADVHQATTKVWYTVVLELVSSFVHQPWW